MLNRRQKVLLTVLILSLALLILCFLVIFSTFENQTQTTKPTSKPIIWTTKSKLSQELSTTTPDLLKLTAPSTSTTTTSVTETTKEPCHYDYPDNSFQGVQNISPSSFTL